MGEYEELNDLVRDGSKKLRDLKNHPEEHVYMHNRPRSSTASSAGILSPRSVSTNYSTHNDAVMGGVSSPSGGRKRGISQDKASSRGASSGGRYPYGASRTSPPKLKSNPRDTRPISHGGGGGSSGSGSNGAGPVNLPPSSRRMNSQASVVSHSTAGVQRGSAPCGVFVDPRSAADGGGGMSTSPAAGAHPSSPNGAYQVPQSNCSFFPAPHGSDERWGAFFGLGWFNCGDHGGSGGGPSRPQSPVQPGHYHATSPTHQNTGNGMYGNRGGHHHHGHRGAGGHHGHHHGGYHEDRGHGYYGGQAPPAPSHGYQQGRSPGYGYGPSAPYSEGRDPSQGFRGSGSVQRDRLVM